MPTDRRVLGTVCLALGLLTLVGRAQQPTFRAETTQVRVEAVVTDDDGNVVRGLTAEDFIIEEDGQRREISTFGFVDLPLGPVSPPFNPLLGEPDVRSNDVPFDGRVYLLVLDDVQASFLGSVRARLVARRFIEEHFRDGDLMTVAYTSGRPDVWQDFTTNRRLLLEAVDAFVGRRFSPQSPTTSLDGTATLSAVPSSAFTSGVFDAQSTLRSIRAIADWSAATMPGRRKSIVLVSEGIPLSMGDVNLCDEQGNGIFVGQQSPGPLDQAVFRVAAPSMSATPLCEAIIAAAKANAAIFTVDPRGLLGAVSGIDDDSRSERVRLVDRQGMNGQRSLRMLGEDSGGLAVVNTNNFGPNFERIVRDSSSYYVLGYEPLRRAPGIYQRIDVRLADRSGVEVRARRGYVVPSEATRASTAVVTLQDAINSPLPISGVPLTVSASAFRGVGGTASVLIGTEVREVAVTPQEPEGPSSAALELVYAVVGARSVQSAGIETVRVAVAPDRAAVAQQGIHLLKRVELPSGRYQLRVGVRDVGSGRIGTVLYDLEVPDFSSAAEPLTMSDLVLATRGDDRVTSGNDPALAPFGIAPTMSRRVQGDEELSVFVEIYDNEEPPHVVDVTTRILSEDGASVSETTERRVRPAGALGPMPFLAAVPVADLAPGAYTVRVSAAVEDAAAGVSASVPFVVVR